MEQPLFTINSTFSEEEVVRFNKYVTLHMSHYVSCYLQYNTAAIHSWYDSE